MSTQSSPPPPPSSGGPIFSAVQVGDVLPGRTFDITRADLVRYAGASGDFNTIHWSDRIARQVGLPGVIAHGMLTMATAVRVVTDWVGDPGAITDYGVRFTQPVPVDDVAGAQVTVSAVIAVKDEAAGTVRVDLTANIPGVDSAAAAVAVLGRARVTVRLPSAR